MTRRQIIAALVLSLAAPLAAEGQPVGKVYTVGLLSIGTDPARPVQWQPFLDAMRELGYVEGAEPCRPTRVRERQGRPPSGPRRCPRPCQG